MTPRPWDLLRPTPAGLYSPPGDFFIDPVRPVPRALITHGQSDHARPGHGAVMATPETLGLMAIRLGPDFAGSTEAAPPGPIRIGSVSVSFHPAGHVLGSAQIAVEADGLRIVAAGDYKRSPDPTCAPFEPVPCDVFITEATFALPVFRHPPPEEEIGKLLRSLALFPERAHLVGVYSLGKAQRLLALLRQAGYDRPVHLHGALTALCDFYLAQGIDLGPLAPATLEKGRKGEFAGAIVLGPPSAFAAPWAQRFPEPLIAFASGWMGVRARARQRGVELPLVISDHADWPELTATIAELSPAETWVTHGRDEALVHWCELHGHLARPLHLVGYEDETE
ncbi:MAG TPA: ligase-associated DNA damage response exonuclease [Paracoccaceae bacterium]|nr:ligase-associated DNA damage response exonuclease [Paracoccaceae bacterium]